MNNEQRLNEFKECKISVENLTFSILVDYANDFLMPAKYNQPYTYPYFKACAVTSGEVNIYLMRYTTETLHENDVIFVGDGVKHTIHDEVGNSKYSVIGLKYSKNNLRSGRDYYKNIVQNLTKPYIVVRNVPKLASLLQRCFDDVMFERKRESELSSHELILEIVSGFEDNALSKSSGVADGEMSRLHKINTILRSCFDKDITINDVAKVLYLSPKQTGRIIKANFGMTWRELLIKRRMRIALWHIGRTDNSIESIAAHVGYRSVRGFYFTFENFYGNPPNFYRNKPELVDEILENDEEWKDYEVSTDRLGTTEGNS